MTGPLNGHRAEGGLRAVAGSPAEPASEEEYRRQIGRRARLVRTDLGLNQGDVAGKAGVSRSFVSAIERGAQGLDLWRLRGLADGLGVSASWLFGLTGEPVPASAGERGRVT